MSFSCRRAGRLPVVAWLGAAVTCHVPRVPRAPRVDGAGGVHAPLSHSH